MLLSIHIPKTGGTKLKDLITEIYGDQLHLDYGTERDLDAARTCAPEIAADLSAFALKKQCIHGHYHYLKYKNLFADEKVIFVLRDPVKRVVSQYRHIALHGDKNVERHRLIMNGEMDIVHFSKFRFVGNAQSAYLEGMDISKENYLPLFSENFRESVVKFLEWVEVDASKYSKYVEKSDVSVNSRQGISLPPQVIPFDESSFEKIRANCQDDVRLYDTMLEKFNKI